jgi:hypothetical protein
MKDLENDAIEAIGAVTEKVQWKGKKLADA